MNLVINQDQYIRYFSIGCLISAIGLLTIWVLPNTIALRHVFLGVGLLAAVPLICKTQFLSREHNIELVPLLLIASLFLWVFIHLTFFSLDFSLELGEVKSLWARVLAGSILAVGLSISLQREPKLQRYFFISLFVISLINIGAYFYMCVKSGAFISFREFVWTFVFKKIEAAFFGVLATSIACANIFYLLCKPESIERSKAIIWWMVGIAIALIASVINITKNGIGAVVGLCALLALTYFVRIFFHEVQSKLKMASSLILLAAIALGGWQINRLFASPGWANFIEDVKISSRIDEHVYWRKNNPIVFPVNSSGAMVSGNVYERMAWATAGVRLIKDYPMGYGSINRSFVGMLNHAKVEQELESQTHSGWIDFGLAFGVPGLVIMSLIFLSIICMGLWHGGQFGLMGIWLSVGLIPFGLVAEICYKHNFEILIFFIAFAAASVVGIRGIKPENRIHEDY